DDEDFQFHKYRPTELRAKLEDAGFHVLRLSRVNALLGLAEIPRELRVRRKEHHSYHGLLASTRSKLVWTSAMKRRWLGIEGHTVVRGVTWPFGRTIVALCERPETSCEDRRPPPTE